ncbi:MAG: retroviral-like aspartic protease family protein [Planctomycetota bacterium]|nr:retroviral-like aspartic protease family protein [Planctomycetota bacterium]
MGIFYTECVVYNLVKRQRSASIPKLLVDTGSEHTWIAEAVLESLGVVREKKDVAFQMANGKTITRSIGFAVLRVGEHFTVDEVVFAEPGDLQLLGARTLEGMGLVPDPRKKRLVASGPIPAA